MIRRAVRALVLPGLLIVLLLAALFAAMDYFEANETAEAVVDATADDTEPAKPSDIPADTDVPPASPDARPISPGRFSTPFADADAPLRRVAPRPPLSQAGGSGGDASPEDGMPRLFRPLVLDAGRLSFSGRPLELAGVRPTPADRFCGDDPATMWPCGMVARTALRNFLRGRALQCDVETEEWEGTAQASCYLGETDVAEWLATHGWVAAKPGFAYEDLAEAARSRADGIFGADPR